jgi:hypothetical protein
MKDLTEQKIESDIRSQQVENWRTAEETESDKTLHSLLGLGWNKEEILNEFCKDLSNEPKFNKMMYVNKDLCFSIVDAWFNCLDANSSDNGEARGRFNSVNDNSIIPF